MKWSIPIATIAGTVVKIHVTFLLLLAAVGMMYFAKGGAVVAAGALAFTGALFLCVLLHEFGHIFAARAFGIRTPDVTLLPIGGLARLERIPEKPVQELIVALAGPMVNVVIAGVLMAMLGLPAADTPRGLDFSSPVGLGQRLMEINIALVIFNMIPAFPMDGGRVLRALLAMFLPYARATAIASMIGQAIAGAGVVMALMWLHPMFFLIALFIFFAARGENEAVQTNEALRHLTLADAMITDFHTLPESGLLKDAADALIAGSQHDFPILAADGSLAGILTRGRLIEGLTHYGPEHPLVGLIFRDIPAVFPATPLKQAFEVLRALPSEVLPVRDTREQGVIGLLSAENIGELLLLRNAIAEWKK
ncbi:site-2 protease family protein [Luteolibacter ambystomatis]|uniref:Zinc metalloprotease n=1 Tax=Luteolibacter ambystomatis TaxID=2824561 RepID=A0A975PGX9_9BACT|nr:site-2 protease family protein [Luteolibacter ambystomatis]QUE52721.1 site-2 protease family protein [Luteolibacter ambystomatis]